MKKIFFSILLGFGIASLFIGCEDVNDQFNGLDDRTDPTNVATYTYTLASADYSTIATKVQKPIADIIKVKNDTINIYKDSLKNHAANATDSARMNSMITVYNNQIAALKLTPTYLLGSEVKSNLYLTSLTPSKDYIPLILTSKFIYGDVKSTAQVTYNYNQEYGYLSAFKNSTVYTVTNTDYNNVGGKVALAKSFTPSYPAIDYIPGILASNISSPTQGQLAVVNYKLTDIEPESADIPITSNFSDNFEGGNLNQFVAYSVTGAQVWGIDATHGVGGSKCAKISGYASGNNDNEDWLIIPPQNLQKLISFSFSTAHKYAGDNLVLKYSTDYSGSGDPTSATWNNLTFTYEAGSGTFAWTSSGNITIPGLPLDNVSVAFVYTSNTTASSTWEIDNLVLNTKSSTASIPLKSYTDCYQYSGSSWTKTSKVTSLSSFEYPGTSAYFSSTSSATSYLPVYLKNKYPLALEGDTTIAVYNYNYYDAVTSTNTVAPKADKYQFSSGVWAPRSGSVLKTDPFAYSSNGWVFDPTVRYTMTKPDYQLVVNYFINHVNNEGTHDLLKYVDSYQTAEYYFGMSGYYGEFNIQISYRKQYDKENFPSTITDDAANTIIAERVKQGLILFLQLKYPSAVAVLNGIDVHYVVTTYIYGSAATPVFSSKTGNYSYEFKCTADGTETTPPSFEYVSGPKLQ